MALHKQPGITYSDLDASDPSALYAELYRGFTHSLIIDNKKCPVGKEVLVSMKTTDGSTLSLPAGYYPPYDFGKTDLSSLGVKVSGFQIAWRNAGSTLWDCTGVSATPGKYFAVIGVSWNEYNIPSLIFVEGP